MNITKEESAILIEKYGKREWEKIKKIDFPPTRSRQITEKSLKNEFNSLKKKDLSWKANSNIIAHFNNDSIIRSNKVGLSSPYDYWQLLKQDYELFCKFLENRYMRSDWYNEKPENWEWLENGLVPDFIYGIGLTTSGKAPKVSIFKPAAAKLLIKNYLQEYNTIFDPFMGFAGRLVGTLACGKSYIGQDLSDVVVEENKKCGEWLKNTFNNIANFDISNVDAFSSNGKYECMLTCPPYAGKDGKQKEEWINSNNEKITCEKTCDEIITYCLDNYKCKKYVFVVDSSIEKYKDNIVGYFENTNYINARNGKLTKQSKNREAIVVI